MSLARGAIKRLAFPAAAAMLLIVVRAGAQDQSVAASAEMGANLPAQPIAPNDLLAISVYGAPELTRTVRVGAEGAIRLPMLKRKIDAAGLMPGVLEERIAKALEQEEILVDPAVTVTIAQYHSRPISVAGAVKHPLTFQVSRPITVLEALARAEGVTEEAGAEILITRPSEAIGETPLVERVPVKALIDTGDSPWNLILNGGEELRVPPVGRVFVVGNVKRPGAFRIDDPFGMTVLKALAMAEGLTPYSTNQAYIYHHLDGTSQEVAVDLRKIMDRKAPDVPLGSSDIFYIPDNRTRRATMNAIEKAIGFATATASGALILGVHP